MMRTLSSVIRRSAFPGVVVGRVFVPPFVMRRGRCVRANGDDVQKSYTQDDMIAELKNLNHPALKVSEEGDGKVVIDIQIPEKRDGDTLNKNERVQNLVDILEGYFKQGGHHLNVNVLNRETLLHAMDHPELYPSLTIRILL